MEFYDLILKREACRNYKADKVDREVLERVLNAARLTPSACNSQPFFYHVVDDEETLKKVAPCLQFDGHNSFCSEVPVLVIVCETPAKLMPGAKLPHQYYAQMDLGASISYFTLAAANEGLGTCIIGYVEDDNAKAALNINKEYTTRLAITVGYPTSQSPRKKTRRNMDEFRKYAK